MDSALGRGTTTLGSGPPRGCGRGERLVHLSRPSLQATIPVIPPDQVAPRAECPIPRRLSCAVESRRTQPQHRGRPRQHRSRNRPRAHTRGPGPLAGPARSAHGGGRAVRFASNRREGQLTLPSRRRGFGRPPRGTIGGSCSGPAAAGASVQRPTPQMAARRRVFRQRSFPDRRPVRLGGAERRDGPARRRGGAPLPARARKDAAGT